MKINIIQSFAGKKIMFSRFLKTEKNISIYIFAGLLFIAFTANSQNVNSLYFLENTPINTRINPAMSPKYSGFGLGVSNFSYYLQSDLAYNDIFYPGENGELYTFMHPDVDKNAFIAGLKDISSINTGASIDFFSLGIRTSKNTYFSLHTGINIDAGLGIPKDLFRFAMIGMDDQASSTTFDMTSLNLETMVYSKTGVGFKSNIGEKVSIGIGVNYLQGLVNAKMNFDELSINASDTEWNIISKGCLRISGPEDFKLSYSEDGYLNGIQSDNSFNSSADYNSAFNSMTRVGSGLSFDLGITVKPIRFLKLSASLVDLGSIKWNKDCVQKANSNGSFTFDGTEFDITGGQESEGNNINIKEGIEKLLHFEESADVESYKSNLTARLNLAAELGLLNNHITFGVLSQTGFSENKKYNDLMLSANFKPGSMLQAALTYSVLNGQNNAIGAAINIKLLMFNLFLAADYIPLEYTAQLLPVSNSIYKLQFGLNFMF
jgi:hypothetical protein